MIRLTPFGSRWRTLDFIARRHVSSALRFVENHVAIKDTDFINEVNEPLLDHLKKRGLIEQVTDEPQLAELVRNEKIGLYCGADPTAISLHLGNLLPLMVLLHFNLRGHKVYGLVGGATGAVGDPSGKTKLREKMETETRLTNVERIQLQLKSFLTQGSQIAKSRNSNFSDPGPVISVNNYSWWKDIKLIDFLATYGSHIRIASMLARDSVKSRLDSPQGLGFNEFSYQILQGFDFHHLFTEQQVRVQVGGNDQYGNIIAGIDLISRLDKSKQAFGVTVPLLTTANGEKFGKSAGNAVFIDSELTSPFQLYQFLFNSADLDLKPFLYKYSFLPTSVIDQVLQIHDQDKKQRLGQKLLAIELCDLIHGEGIGYDNMIISEFLFENKLDLPIDEVIRAFDKQKMLIRMSALELSKLNILQLLIKLDNGVSSKSKLKRLILSRSVQIGLEGDRVQDIEVGINLDNLILGKLLFIRVGKTDHYVVEVI